MVIELSPFRTTSNLCFKTNKEIKVENENKRFNENGGTAHTILSDFSREAKQNGSYFFNY